MTEFKDVAIATIKTYRVRTDEMSGIDPKYMLEFRQFDHDCPEPITVEHVLHSIRPVKSSVCNTPKSGERK